MLNIFKNPFQALANVTKREPTKEDINKIIDEIHESFYTEVDKLLKEAKILNSLDTDKQELIDKCERLKALGFTNTKEVNEAGAEINRLTELKRKNKEKEGLIKAINYFSVKYPNYKFITEESVKNICKKYTLVYGPVEKYIGEVPENNLKHIEEFQVGEEDVLYLKRVFDSLYGGYNNTNEEIVSYERYQQQLKKQEETYELSDSDRLMYRMINMGNGKIFQAPLEIAAPIKDFNTEGMKLNGFKLNQKIEIPDPVVLQPIYFEGVKHYLIVTAWGQEASDVDVVNEKLN